MDCSASAPSRGSPVVADDDTRCGRHSPEITAVRGLIGKRAQAGFELRPAEGQKRGGRQGSAAPASTPQLPAPPTHGRRRPAGRERFSPARFSYGGRAGPSPGSDGRVGCKRRFLLPAEFRLCPRPSLAAVLLSQRLRLAAQAAAARGKPRPPARLRERRRGG